MDNRPVLEDGHSTLSAVQFKNGWSYSFTNHFYGVHRGQFKLQNFGFIRCVKTIVFHEITHLSFDVFLTVHLSIFILVFNQLDAQDFVSQ